MWSAEVAAAGRLAPLLLAGDARRPAAWIGLVTAAGAGLGCPTGGGSAAVAAAVGGLAAVAAVGQPPPSLAGGWRRAWLVPLVRSSWPLMGVALAAAWRAVSTGPAAAGVALWVGVGVVLAAGLIVGFARGRVGESVVAGRCLMVVGLGSAAGLAAAATGASPLLQAAAMVAAWALAGCGLVAAAGQEQAVGAVPGGDGVAGRGPAMASALLAMAGCYFLAPQFAWGYAVIAVGWFVVLAVPAATAARGSAAAVRLVRSSPGRPAAPGTLARAVPLVATIAALLAWPAVVAAVLAGPEAGNFGGPLAAVVALALGSCLTLAAVAAGSRCGNEVARALALAAFGVGATAAAWWAANLPAAPGFPGFSPVTGP